MRIESYCVADDLVRATRLGAGQIPGVGHTQRGEDMVERVDVQRLAGDPLDDGAEQNEPDVGVVEDLTRRELHPCVERPADAVLLVRRRQAPRTVVAQIAGDAGGVGEHHA